MKDFSITFGMNQSERMRLRGAWAGALGVMVASALAAPAAPEGWVRIAPPQAWPTAAPEEVGIDSVPLVEMLDFVRERQIPGHSIQLVRGGRLVLDAYFYPYDGRTPHDVASVTKSITSTLVGLAIERGYILDGQQPVLSFFPGRCLAGLDARKKRQTLEHLLTMQSGWDCGAPL